MLFNVRSEYLIDYVVKAMFMFINISIMYRDKNKYNSYILGMKNDKKKYFCCSYYFLGWEIFLAMTLICVPVRNFRICNDALAASISKNLYILRRKMNTETIPK